MPLNTRKALKEQNITGFTMNVLCAISDVSYARNRNTPRAVRKKNVYSDTPNNFSTLLKTAQKRLFTIECYQSAEIAQDEEYDSRQAAKPYCIS